MHREEIVSEQLQAALHHRTVVEQAKGVLADAGGLNMYQAYTRPRPHPPPPPLRGRPRCRHGRLDVSEVLVRDAWTATR